MTRMHEVTAALGGRFAFGGDYNPEQWPAQTWTDDIALMGDAGVNLVSLGIFSWALLEPIEGSYEFGWLDDVLARLHEGGIAVDLATATASPPAWFLRRHPSAALVDADGVRRSFGGRQAYCPSSTAYRSAAGALAGRLASRYANHPAVVMWHVNNEYGCHNWHCFCDESARAFRRWLERRYRSVDALNDAWGTAFWSQRYADWDQVDPPRTVAYNTFANPGQQLDWWRFCSSELLECFRTEAAAVRAAASQPLTTNFMGFFKPLDYREWAPEQDVVSNDHYLLAEDADNAQQLAMTADLLRSLAGGEPWLLMEHSTSAVNWQPRNLAKRAGEMRRNSFQHLARGADGALFFQWRASRAGAEKFHSGMVPHAGTDTRIWREVVALGDDLRRISEVTGTTTAPAPVAIVFDWPSWWAAGLDSHPSTDVDPLRTTRRWHDLCWRTNVGVDVVTSDADLVGYRLVVVPVQYLMSTATADRLGAYVAAGGTIVATYFSGIVDEHDRVHLGGYPGALRALLGVAVEEFYPLAARRSVDLGRYGSGTVWSEAGTARTAEVLDTFAEGPTAGSPAVTRNAYGAGHAWYVATEPSDSGLADLGRDVFAAAGVRPTVAGLTPGVEVVRRVSPGREDSTGYLFVINHTDQPVDVDVPGTELLTGVTTEQTTVGPGDVAVIRELSLVGRERNAS